MSYAVISSSLITQGKAAILSLWSQVKDNFDSHESRINTLEYSKLVVPIGSIVEYDGAVPPYGYLECNGQTVSRTRYSALFSEIGIVFGSGDGSTTFTLPDYRGRTQIGAGTGSGLTARTVGGAVGEETHLLSSAEMPSHNHDQNHPVAGHFHTWSNCFNAAGGGSSGYGFGFDGCSVTITTTNETSGCSAGNNTPAGSAHANVQPSLCVRMIIKF